MKPLRVSLESFGRVTLFASLAVVMFKLSVAQVLFGLSAIAWLLLTVRDKHHPPLPRFAWPLLAYAGLTVLSALLSLDPRTSIIDLKQLVLYLLVPMVMRFARGRRATTALDVIIAAGAGGAVLGVIQTLGLGHFGDLEHRPEGTLSHYMTYSGVIMLVLCAAASKLLLSTGAWIWPAVAVPALALALAATMSRNVYLGAIAGIGCVLAARRVRLLLVVPVVIALAFVLGPVRERALSAFDMQDESSRDRIQMWGIGARIIHDYPAFGVGPNEVIAVYPKYRPAEYVRSHPVNVHLHNVFIQIGAERGLLALAAWLVFVGVAAAGLIHQVRWGPSRALGGAGLAAVAAMLAAGLFEHNFGDSEFLMLFLGMITLPYAARLDDAEAGVDGGEPAGVPVRRPGLDRRRNAAAAAVIEPPADNAAEEERPWR